MDIFMRSKFGHVTLEYDLINHSSTVKYVLQNWVI